MVLRNRWFGLRAVAVRCALSDVAQRPDGYTVEMRRVYLSPTTGTSSGQAVRCPGPVVVQAGACASVGAGWYGPGSKRPRGSSAAQPRRFQVGSARANAREPVTSIAPERRASPHSICPMCQRATTGSWKRGVLESDHDPMYYQRNSLRHSRLALALVLIIPPPRIPHSMKPPLAKSIETQVESRRLPGQVRTLQDTRKILRNSMITKTRVRPDEA